MAAAIVESRAAWSGVTVNEPVSKVIVSMSTLRIRARNCGL
ncbi:hypothetical protein IFDJLNFL_5801 [Methylobacterium dankookense]|uniref:Uncharacterized protein n=1 Tax=Methylobacterium dankookense TaxID=560405 RepID=A0ABQ4RRP1_9HYPH|nr:hypothetical protein IFDJLNFL_5801 [Methylobacterium dankookense]